MWFVNRRFELHCGSPSPGEQRMPEVFTVTQTHGYPSLPEARRPSAGWVTSWHPKLPPCGVPLRSPRGEMDHVAACCSWNDKYLRGCPAQRSTGFRRGEAPSLCSLSRCWRVGGGGGLGGEQPLPGPACSLGYCSQMGTVNPCQLQIRTERPPSAFLGCVAAQSSPSAPGFNNMSNPFSLTQS